MLRKAGDVLSANADEIKGWLARESGAIQPFGDFQVHTSAQECYSAGTDYGLSLGILTKDVYAGLQLAERIPSGLVHINDQTVNDEAVAPFGGVGHRVPARRTDGQHRGVHRDAMGHPARRPARLPLLSPPKGAMSPG